MVFYWLRAMCFAVRIIGNGGGHLGLERPPLSLGKSLRCLLRRWQVKAGGVLAYLVTAFARDVARVKQAASVLLMGVSLSISGKDPFFDRR